MSTSNRGRNVKYQANIVLEDAKCDTEIQTRIRLAKEAFQNLINVLRNKISLLEPKKDCRIPVSCTSSYMAVDSVQGGESCRQKTCDSTDGY